jgi:glycosyltransferase involved in cell wall biosynthesis
MRVLFITEKSYPHHLSGVSNWSHELITGMPQHRFVVMALGSAQRQQIIYDRPRNLEQLFNLRFGVERSNVREATASDRDRFMVAMSEQLEFLQKDLPCFTKGLRDLAALGHEVNLWPLFDERSLWPRVQSLLRSKLPYTPSLAEIALCIHWLRNHLVPLLRIPPHADLVHTTVNSFGAIPAWLASHFHEIPLVLTEHHVALRERYLDTSRTSNLLALKRFQASFFELLSRLIYWQADRIVAVSEFNRTWQLRFAAPRERTTVIHHGLEFAHYPDLTQLDVAAQIPNAPTIVWVGRIHPLKDLETLVSAFWQVRQLNPDARLELYGPVVSPRYAAKIKAQLQQLQLGEAVTFNPAVIHSHQAFVKGDVVVSSSKSEGFPLTLLEAMACGKPIVATQAGGVRELLADAGRIVPAQSSAALAAALVDLLQHPDKRFKLAHKARERAKGFTLEKMLVSYATLYDDVTAPLRPREAPVFITTERKTLPGLTLLNGNGQSNGSADYGLGGAV